MARFAHLAEATGTGRGLSRAEERAAFVERAGWDDLSPAAREALKIRVLDSLGCAFGALGGEPVRMIRQDIDEFGGSPLCTLIGGGKTSPDRARSEERRVGKECRSRWAP